MGCGPRCPVDPARNNRNFRQVAKRYPLAGLLWCGLCGRQLVSNPLRGVPSFICSPTARGGCGKIRVHGEHVERYLLERIHEREPAAVEDPASARVRTALRQVQDDYYDGLIDRVDFLRESQRLRTALRASRDIPLPEAWTDTDKRTVLHRALDRVTVHPHPRGRAASHLTCEQRRSLLHDRLELNWA